MHDEPPETTLVRPSPPAPGRPKLSRVVLLHDVPKRASLPRQKRVRDREREKYRRHVIEKLRLNLSREKLAQTFTRRGGIDLERRQEIRSWRHKVSNNSTSE